MKICIIYKIVVSIFLLSVHFASTTNTPDHRFQTTACSANSAFPVIDTPVAESRIFTPPQTKRSHSPSIAELPDGRLMTVWYGGSREGAKDVKIWYTIFEQNGKGDNHEEPRVLLDRETLQRQTKRYIRKLGNPIIFVQGKRLYCWVVSVSVGGWSASSLNYAYSDDCGKTWTPFQKLRTSPLFNISNLVRSSPVPMSDNCIGFPIYHELINKYSQFLVLDSSGKILKRSRIPSCEEGLQPAIAATDPYHAIAVMRNANIDEKGQLLAAYTEDAGQSWQVLPDFPLPNPNSSISIVRTPEGKLILAANSEQGRSVLNLYGASENNLRNWVLLSSLENSPHEEFSYPSLLLSKNGKLCLVYTWKRLGIKYSRFQIDHDFNEGDKR